MYTDRNKSFLSTLIASNSEYSNEGWRATLGVKTNKRFSNVSGNTVLSQEFYEEDIELDAKEKFTCGVSEELLQDYVDSELDELTAHRVERHIDACKRCEVISKELIELKILAKSLNSTGSVSLDIHGRLRAKLMAELNIDIDMIAEEEL